jgi:hypothetical protein
MTTEIKIGQKFSVNGLNYLMTITNITEKGKIYYSSGNKYLATKNIMTKSQITKKELVEYIKLGHWNFIK